MNVFVFFQCRPMLHNVFKYFWWCSMFSIVFQCSSLLLIGHRCSSLLPVVPHRSSLLLKGLASVSLVFIIGRLRRIARHWFWFALYRSRFRFNACQLCSMMFMVFFRPIALHSFHWLPRCAIDSHWSLCLLHRFLSFALGFIYLLVSIRFHWGPLTIAGFHC